MGSFSEAVPRTDASYRSIAATRDQPVVGARDQPVVGARDQPAVGARR